MRAELAFSLKPTPIAHTPRQHIPAALTIIVPASNRSPAEA
jgi:hypothetical protein